MQYKSINRAKRRGHVGVVQSSHFSFMTRRVKSDKKGSTYKHQSGISNNVRWFQGNTDAESGELIVSGKYTFL